MRTVLSLLRPRAVWLLGLAALGVAQAGCAQPVWIEPSVVLQARIGGPAYGPMYGRRRWWWLPHRSGCLRLHRWSWRPLW